MSVVFTRAPLRLSLGGGGTDLPSYYARAGGFLVAAAIDQYVYILAHTLFQRRYRLKYTAFEEVDTPAEIRHPLFREALRHYWDGEPLELTSVADIPAGTGLGSSGAFTVCLLKSLALAGRRPITPAALAEAACRIEIDILGEPVGKQDQYAAAHGGICAYEFAPDGAVEVRPLRLPGTTLDRLERQLLMFYTGETRSASTILADQDRRSRDADPEMIANLDRTKEMGRESCRLLEAGQLTAFGELMHEHWENKRRRSPGVTSEAVDELYAVARAHGAVGGKLVGAGGGGFLLLYTETPDRVRAAFAERDVMEVPFGFDFEGCVGRL